jgi:peptide/nickel transport system substrate-binding protein
LKTQKKIVLPLVFILTLSALLMLVGTFVVAQQPLYGGTFIRPTDEDPPHLNPIRTTEHMLHIFAGQIYSSLLRQYPNMTLGPYLAQSWVVSEDGLNITFTLRNDVQWSDGTAFTSADVKFTVEELWLNATICPYGPALYEKILSVSAPDDYTAVFHLSSPYAPLFNYLGTTQYGAILPKHIWEVGDVLENSHNQEDPIGTGPFLLEEWVLGDHITLVRNPLYFEEGKPYLDKVIYKIIPGLEPANVAAFEAGEIDWMAVPISLLEDWMANPDYNVFEAPNANMAIGAIICNLNHSIIGGLDATGIKVRQALYHTINKTWVLDVLYEGVGSEAVGPFNSRQTMAYNPDVQQYEFNLTLADQMLDDAGYPKDIDGWRFELYYPLRGSATGVAGPDFAEWWAEQLEQVGVKLNYELLDVGAWYGKWSSGDFDVNIETSYHGPDPSVTTARFFISSNIKPGTVYTNTAGYNNSRVDELFDYCQKEADYDLRKDAFFEIQDILLEELPNLWVYETATKWVIRDTFHGFPDSAYAAAQVLADTWWEGGYSQSPEDLQQAIDDAQTQLDGLAGQMYDVTQANTKLEEARAALAANDYSSVASLVQEALALPVPPYWLYGLVVVIIVGVVGAFIWNRRRSRPSF